VTFGWTIYQQIAAIFAAIGLAALADHWWHIGWRGALGSLVGIWGETVRPAMAAVFHVLVTVPLGWVHIHVEVPLVVRDYLSVGAIFAASVIRDLSRSGRVEFGIRLPFFGLVLLIAWPLYALGCLAVVLSRRIADRVRSEGQSATGERLTNLRVLSPLVYLGILFAVNFWVLR
jgi:hypothetical protein